MLRVYIKVHSIRKAMSSAAATASSSMGEEVETEEAILQLKVPKVSSLEDVAFSKPTHMKGHQWRIMVVHREVNSKGSEPKKDVMGAYIQHVGPKTIKNPSWSVVINASVTLVNQVDTDRSFTKDFRHQYTRNSTDWGYSNFLRWKEVINPVRGFIKDDAIIIVARLIYLRPDDPLSSSSSQSLNTSSLSQSPACSPIQSLPRTITTTTRHLPTTLSASQQQQQQSVSFSQLSSSQESLCERNQLLTPTSTSVLLPEMTLFLSCPHCNEQFEEEGQRRPNTLHCGHTFCLGCLKQLVVKIEEEDNKQQQHLTCPTCNNQHTLDTNNSSPWFPNHSMIQLINTVRSKAKHFCPTHQHDCNYYCLEDKILVCIYCAYHGDHAGHRCQTVHEARETIKDELRPVRIQARGRVTELERRLQLLKDEQEIMKVQVKNSIRCVEEYYSSLEAVLRRQRDQLLGEYRSLTGSLHNTFEVQVRDLERRHGMAKRSLEDYEKWKSLSPREALTNLSSLSQTLQATAKTSLPHHTTVATKRKLYIELPLASPLSSLGPMGHVTVTCSSPTSPSSGTKSVDQEGPLAVVVNGNREIGSHDQSHDQLEESGREATVDDEDSDTVMETQEEENPVREELVKRSISPPDHQNSKKRKT